MDTPVPDPENRPSASSEAEAAEQARRAREYFAQIQDENGVDLTLIRENLKLTPTERVRRMDKAAKAVKRIQANARRLDAK